MRRRIASLAAGAALIAPSPAAHAAQKEDFTVPAWAGMYQPEGEDERGLWQLTDEIERQLDASSLVIRDEALTGYIGSVLCRTVGDDRCQNVRVYVVRAPTFNASMAANGYMLVNTGLLLRLRNEAELAAVLGHEFAHFERRHSLAGFRNRRTGSDVMAWAALAGAVATGMGASPTMSSRELQLTVLGGLASYDRRQEREADLLGFGYMARAGYRPGSAAEVWRVLMNEADASAEGRHRRTRRYDEVAFLASHPTNLERADYLSALANRVPGGEFEGASAYGEAVAPWLQTFLDDQLALNDFGGTNYLISRLSGGESPPPELLLARAEMYRSRGNPRDLQEAIGLYRQALTARPDFHPANRGLGLSLMRSGQQVEGREALGRYLAANPEANDAAMLRSMIGN
jgi:predicted Zn-dependent protease